jgi:hypothetical protein
MHAPEWIALITPGFAVAGACYAVVVKLTRMAVALEQLTTSMKAAAEKVDSHEARIAALELRSPGRHARII